jgi:hypothetical protein
MGNSILAGLKVFFRLGHFKKRFPILILGDPATDHGAHRCHRSDRKNNPQTFDPGEVQLSTRFLLMSVGIRFMMGTSKFHAMQDAVELHLAVQALRPLPISQVIGFDLPGRTFYIVSDVLSFGAMMISTRRFWARPSGVSFPATGS